MIGYLTGRMLRRDPERVLLDVGGVGYEVSIPLSTFYELEKCESDGAISLFIHTHVREDALELFGFWTEREKQVFERLISVSGIGPKLARVILSGMAPEQLMLAIAGGDTARLATIPGIGKKTAERMVVDLQDRMRRLSAELEETPKVDDTGSDLVQALVNLGYKLNQAERAVVQVRETNPDAPFHELLRLSLQRLSRA